MVNGAYGRRIVKTAEMNKIDVTVLEYPENEAAKAEDVDRVLSEDPEITNVVLVHCETTSKIMNPIDEIGRVVRKHGKSYFVDAMSSFGATKIDWLVSSANKCIEGGPDFSFIICRRDALLAAFRETLLEMEVLDRWAVVCLKSLATPPREASIT